MSIRSPASSSNRATFRLLEDSDSIQETALQAAYRDPFFFSHDFKRYTGVSPTGFRHQERPPGQGAST